MSPKHSFQTWLLGLALAGSFWFVTACASLDRATYESTVDLPTTITIEDPYTHHVYWGMEIPVSRSLTVDLDRAGDFEFFRVSGKPATSLHWKLTGPGKDESGSLALPGTPVIVVVSYRPSPEYPAGYTGPRPGEPGVSRVNPTVAPSPQSADDNVGPAAPAPMQPQAVPAIEPGQPAGLPTQAPAPVPPNSAQGPANQPPSTMQELDQALEPQEMK